MSFAVLGLYLASWMASPQTVDIRLPAPAGAPVAGRVVGAVSRAPIAGATVVLIPTVQQFPPGAVTLHTATDANGEFMFQRVPSGRYRIEAQKPGFAPLTAPSGAQTIEVAAGRPVTDLELVLQAGAVIAGRIADATGGPLPEVTVTALRQSAGPDGQTLATTARMAQTNDQGEFRLEGLPEGNYLVIAAPLPPPPFAPPPAPTMVLAPTYYPGTRDRDTAAVIAVASAQTVDHLQFSLLALAAHEVSGVVIDEAGSPLAGAIVALMADPTRGRPATPVMGQTDQNGAFRIGGIVSGTYRLMVGGAPPVAKSGPSRSVGAGAVGGVFFGGAAPSEITVGDTDVTGLRIVLPANR